MQCCLADDSNGKRKKYKKSFLAFALESGSIHFFAGTDSSIGISNWYNTVCNTKGPWANHDTTHQETYFYAECKKRQCNMTPRTMCHTYGLDCEDFLQVVLFKHGIYISGWIKILLKIHFIRVLFGNFHRKNAAWKIFHKLQFYINLENSRCWHYIYFSNMGLDIARGKRQFRLAMQPLHPS